jgi:hypothetical protein
LMPRTSQRPSRSTPALASWIKGFFETGIGSGYRRLSHRQNVII